MNSIKHILLALGTLVLAQYGSHTFAQQAADDAAMGSVTAPTGQVYKTPKSVPKSITRVTLYRPADSSGAGVTGLQVNGHYHTSLQLGSFTDVCLNAPAKAQLTARVVETGKPVQNMVDATASLDLKAGQEAYVRVLNVGNGLTMMREVDAVVAQADLKPTRRQTHALSRVTDAVPCEPDAPKEAQQVETITLAADALFGFGKSDINAISKEGRNALDQLIARLQKTYGAFDDTQLQVLGYADPLGNSAGNQRLSAARAKTIKDYMVKGGIAADKVTSEGRGATDLIVASCAKNATPESIECNKPNRRVVVGVNKVQAR